MLKTTQEIQMKLQKFANVSIFDLVSAPEIGTYWETLGEELEPLLGEELFPNDKRLGMDLEWFKGQTGAPKGLKPSALDADVIPRDRKEFDKVITEMVFFKESYYIDERVRQELLKVIQTGNQEYINNVMERIFDDVAELVRAARIRAEITRMELLSAGEVTIQGNGQTYFLDYEFPANHKFDATADWTEVDSDPLADIEDAMDKIEEDTGVRPTRAIINNTVVRQLRNNNVVQANLYPNGAGNIRVSRQDVLDYVRDNLGLDNVVVYSKRYVADDGATKPYIADNTVLLLPPTDLGKSWYGTTPEEADLMSGATEAEVSIIEPGVAVTTMKKADPVTVETKVSMFNLPSYEAINQVGILTTVAP